MHYPRFQQQYILTPKIGKGRFGRVYALSDKYAAKVIYYVQRGTTVLDALH